MAWVKCSHEQNSLSKRMRAQTCQITGPNMGVVSRRGTQRPSTSLYLNVLESKKRP